MVLPNACEAVSFCGVAGPPIPNVDLAEPSSSAAIRFWGGVFGSFAVNDEPPKVLPEVCFGVTTVGVVGFNDVEKVPPDVLFTVGDFGIVGFVLATRLLTVESFLAKDSTTGLLSLSVPLSLPAFDESSTAATSSSLRMLPARRRRSRPGLGSPAPRCAACRA